MYERTAPDKGNCCPVMAATLEHLNFFEEIYLEGEQNGQ